MKEKANDLFRLHKAAQEKLRTASYSEQVQILTLVPDKWSRMYCSEYFNVFEYLVWTSHEIKKAGRVLAKPAPKKGKIITTQTLYLVTNVYEYDSFSRKRKTILVPVKQYIIKNFATCKSLCKLQNCKLLSKKNTQM